MNAKATESQQVKKARQKLKKQLNKEQKQMNPKALARVSKCIQQWISRHSQERVDLKDKSIALFDENQHPANISSDYIQSLRESISQDFSQENAMALKGRIKKDE